MQRAPPLFIVIRRQFFFMVLSTHPVMFVAYSGNGIEPHSAVKVTQEFFHTPAVCERLAAFTLQKEALR